MKYLLLLLVIFGFSWYWRHSREQAMRNKPPGRKQPPLKPQGMVACALCGTHVPESEAVTGARGVYCSTTHRTQQER